MATGRLGASNMSAGSNTSIYTCPADTYAVASLNICNRGNQATSIRIAVADNATPALGEYIEYEVELLAKGEEVLEMYEFDLYFPLAILKIHFCRMSSIIISLPFKSHYPK